MTIPIHASEFETAREAIQHAHTTRGDKAILLHGRNMVVSQQDADRLAAARIEFAYLFDHRMPDGTPRIMTVPVN